MRATDTLKTQNASVTTAGQTLYGGKYAMVIIATYGGGTVKLQYLGPDGTTWLDVGTSTTFTAAPAGIITVDLPPGQYRLNIATSTGVYVTLCRVPVEA